MNEDYLWDKTGSDPEIERLENALKTFRQHDPTPPVVQPAADDIEGESSYWVRSRRQFTFGIASFATAALVVFAFGIFQILKLDNSLTDQRLSVNGSDRKDATQQIKDMSSQTPVLAENILETGKKRVPPKRLDVRRNGRRNRTKPIRSRRATQKRATRSVTKPKSIKLTKEEQYAYDQLILGLTITSSNLKNVKDKVQGTE
jgi:hypothetical protein